MSTDPSTERGIRTLRDSVVHALGDAWDVPDTGLPPCIYCLREIPCDCYSWAGGECKCACGRCQYPGAPELMLVLIGQLRWLRDA